MDARLNFITLAVADVASSRAFYGGGLGWTPAFEVKGEIVFIRLSPTRVLSSWRASEFEVEAGPIAHRHGLAPFGLAHNVPCAEALDVCSETSARLAAPS